MGLPQNVMRMSFHTTFSLKKKTRRLSRDTFPLRHLIFFLTIFLCVCFFDSRSFTFHNKNNTVLFKGVKNDLTGFSNNKESRSEFKRKSSLYVGYRDENVL